MSNDNNNLIIKKSINNNEKKIIEIKNGILVGKIINNDYFKRISFKETKYFINDILNNLYKFNNDYLCCNIENILSRFLNNYIIVSNGNIALCNENVLNILNNKDSIIEVLSINDYNTMGYIYIFNNSINIRLNELYTKQTLELLKSIINDINDEYNIKINDKVLKK